MSQPLDPLRQLQGMQANTPITNKAKVADGAESTEGSKSFNDVMKSFVSQVDEAQHQFDDAIKAVESGDTDNLHQVMLAQAQAQQSLRLAAEVRNKLVEAYREVMRTQF